MVYRTSENNDARFILGSPGVRTLIVIGVNPSTATDVTFDPTIRKVIGFAKKNRFDGWVTLNVYPQRTTDPAGLDVTENSKMHRNNLAEISRLLESLKGKEITVWAAWGDLIDTRPYLMNCLRGIYELLKPYGAPWVSLERATKKGHPRHPSRPGYETPMAAFDVDSYLHFTPKG